MRKNFLKLNEFLAKQFADWSDIKFDIEHGQDDEFDITVKTAYIDASFMMRSNAEGIEIHIDDGLYHEATEKYFWIVVAPLIFPNCE